MFSKSDIADIYPLSPMQESMLLHCRLHPRSRAYFEQRSYQISGPLDIAGLRAAFDGLVARHAALRTIFVAEKSKRSLQIVVKPRATPWHQHDFRGIKQDEQNSAVAEVRRLDLQKGLDCTGELPIRITLCQLGESSFELLWSMHHIVVDGWSVAILYAELMELYRSIRGAASAQLPGVAPFSRYITWLESRDRQESLSFWRRELEGYRGETILPGQNTRRPERPGDGGRVRLTCEPGVGPLLQSVAARWQVSVSTIVHTLWGLLLGWYNDSDDVVFGSVVSGRPESLAGSDRMVGLCINTIPVRIRLGPGIRTLRQIAQAVQQQALAASDHHFCDLAEIQNVTAAKRKLINHLVAVENFPRAFRGSIQGVDIRPTASHEQVGYDLALVVVPGDPFEIELHFDHAAFDFGAANRIAGHVRTMLGAVARNPDMQIDAADPLSAEEYSMLDSLNATTRAYDDGITLGAQFDRRVKQSPLDTAVTDHEGSVSYQELGALAERVAGYLHRQPAFSQGECVAVMVDRSRWLAAALFGILKAGGTYVPLDPQCPAPRAATILKDCRCRFVLTLPHLRDSPAWGGDIMVTDVTRIDGPACESAAGSPRSAAYIIFTSGSTGTPKGVAISHASVVNFASWFGRYYDLGPSTHSTLLASPAFDASILELIPVLLAGGSLHCLRDNVLDGEGLIAFYREHAITLSFVPPVLCEEICRIHDGRLPPDFRLLTGGDVLRSAGDGSFRVFNNYGPTETTVMATVMEVTGLGDGRPIPIGLPIDNTELFILDRYGRRAAIGAVGELHIGGAGVAQGYVGREDLTGERFALHPVRPGERLYRTGDRVRVSLDQGLFFVGRIDTQIKLRGFRIEPAEIERALRDHPLVRDSAVVVGQEAGGAMLVAFLVAEGNEGVPADQLRSFLRQTLPEYMIPARFVRVERLPLTVSGKIDREGLLEAMPPVQSDAAAADSEPLSPVEAQLAAIWRDVIGADAVGRHDNFFALGGHSLSATRMTSRIRQDLAAELSLRVIFDTPVLADLARYIETLAARPASLADKE